MAQLSGFVPQSAANKALHRTAIPLRSIAAGELGRYMSKKMNLIKNEINELWDYYTKRPQIKSPYDNEFNKTILEHEKQAENDAIENLSPWLQILEEGIQWLANLNATLDVALKESGRKTKGPRLYS